MLSFCHISPTKHNNDFCHPDRQKVHLCLAHLVEEDAEYRDWYKNVVSQRDDTTIILDNSQFEMTKQGLPPFPPDRLLECAKEISCDYIVMPDFPGERSSVTISNATKYGELFKQEGFGTFFCPQSRVGDIEDLAAGFKHGIESDLCDYIGVSILAVPNAYGVEKGNKLQRFFARYSFINNFLKNHHTYRNDVYDQLFDVDCRSENGKKVHFLGMVDGPNEILLMENLVAAGLINTWDSSCAVWYGLNGIQFDSSPTGSINGKFEEEVDFSFETVDTRLFDAVVHNIDFIKTVINNASGE